MSAHGWERKGEHEVRTRNTRAAVLMYTAPLVHALSAVALGRVTLRSGALPHWLRWLGAVLAPLLVIAGWTFALSASTQLAAYTVLLLVLLLWVAAIGVVSLRRAA
jgi:hypothetical protein